MAKYKKTQNLNLFSAATQHRLVYGVIAFGAPLLFMLTMLGSTFLPQHAAAASYTWDGGGADNNWSTCANWSTDICPVAGDSVTFNGTSTKDSTIDASWGGSLTGLTIASGYTGTITMARSLTLSGGYSQATGTFTAGANNLSVAGTLSLSGGSFTAPSTTLQLNGALTISGAPTFSANGGLVNVGGATNATLSCNNVSFNSVTFTHAAANIKTISSNCSLPLGANPSISGRIALNGNLSGSGTLTLVGSSTNNLNATASLTGFTGLASGLPLTFTGGTFDFSNYTTFDMNGAFALSATTTFTAPSGQASFAAGFTVNTGAVFNANNGTVVFDGGSATLACAGVVFNQVTFVGGVNKAVSNDCSLPIGNNPNIAGTITLAGSLIGTGTLTIGGNLTLNSGSVLNGFNGLIVSGASTSTLTINTDLNLSSYSPVTANIFILNSGIFTAPAGDMRVPRDFTINGGTFNANGGTLIFDGTAAATLSCNNATFNLVQFAHNSTIAKTVSSNCSLPLGNNPTVGSGTGADLVLNGTLTGTGTLTIADATSGNALTLNSTAVLSGFSGLVAGALTTTSYSNNFTGYAPFSVGGAYSQSGGTISVPNSADFKSSFALSSAGSFTAPSGTMSVAGSFTLNTGTSFNANNGTLTFYGAGGVFNCNNTVFNLAIFNKTTGGTTDGTINANCTFPLGNNPTAAFGSTSAGWTINGLLTGSGVLTITTGGLNFNSPGAMTGFSGVNGASRLNFSGGTIDFGSFSPMTLFQLRLSNGANFTAPSGELRTSNLLLNAGTTFNANGGTVIIQGNDTSSGTYTLDCNNAVFNLVRLEQATRTTISSNCTLPLGNNPVISSPDIRVKPLGRQELQLAGKLVGTGTITLYGVLRLDATYQLEGFSSITADYVTVNNATANLSSFDSLNILFDLSVPNGSFTPPANMSVGRNISRTGGAFNANGGTVALTGTDQTITGDIGFYNLTKTTSGIVTVGAGNTITTTGLLKLSGPALVSAAPGVSWNLNMQGTTNICYVSVTDSVGTGNAVVAYQSTSNSANPGWVFLNSACPGSGGGGGGGTGGEPTSTVTNYTNAQAAATAAGITTTTPSTTLPPYFGLPSTLAKTVDTIPGSREALRAFLRFVGITGLIMALTGGIIWFVVAKRRRDEDEAEDMALGHWNGTRVG